MGTTPYKLPRFIREPAEVYHGKSRENFTSHALAAYKRCPLELQLSRAGLMPFVIPEFFTEGAAIHCLSLEGRQQFDATYIVGGPINEKTGRPYHEDTKAFSEWAAQQTKLVVSEAQYATACHVSAALHAHPEAGPILADPDGVAEGVLRAVYAGIPSQIRCDWFAPRFGLADLKTCDDLDGFYPTAVEAFGYIDQVAFYRELIRLTTGERVPGYLIGAEKKPPYRVGVWRISDRRLDTAERINFSWMREVAASLEFDHWPTGYEHLRVIE